MATGEPFVDRVLEWMSKHPVVTVVLLILLVTGGCAISVSISIH